MIHRFIPGVSPTLLLLHGTGGNEDDLIPLGKSIAPGASLLSPRGEVLERGMPRFFRRLAEGVFDEPDLIRRTADLADFIRSAAETYRFDEGAVVALGYSNGANIAASMLLLKPNVLSAAALMHPMVPLTPERLPRLAATRVIITAGDNDPVVPPDNTERLAAMLRRAGATVEVHWHMQVIRSPPKKLMLCENGRWRPLAPPPNSTPCHHQRRAKPIPMKYRLSPPASLPTKPIPIRASA